MADPLNEAIDRLDQTIDRVGKELAAFRQHKKLPADVKVGDLDDMQRLASLYTHDMALPTSTNGEVALGRCVVWLVERVRVLEERATRIPSSYDE